MRRNPYNPKENVMWFVLGALALVAAIWAYPIVEGIHWWVFG
jgi:hypothetical protein